MLERTLSEGQFPLDASIAGKPLCYGDLVKLCTQSRYAPLGDRGYVGWYSKRNLTVVSPLSAGEHPFRSAEGTFAVSVFTVLDPEDEVATHGKPVRAGAAVVLVDQNNMVWNNKPSGEMSLGLGTGYIGPRKRGRRGEMHVRFVPVQLSDVEDPEAAEQGTAQPLRTALSGLGASDSLLVECERRPSDSPFTKREQRERTVSFEDGEDGVALHRRFSQDGEGNDGLGGDGDGKRGGKGGGGGGGGPAGSNKKAASASASAPASAPASAAGGGGSGGGIQVVRYGQRVYIDVADSHRTRKAYDCRLSNFKKPSSNIVGGYVCSDGQGWALRFTIVDPDHIVGVPFAVPATPPLNRKSASKTKEGEEQKFREVQDGNEAGRGGHSANNNKAASTNDWTASSSSLKPLRKKGKWLAGIAVGAELSWLDAGVVAVASLATVAGLRFVQHPDAPESWFFRTVGLKASKLRAAAASSAAADAHDANEEGAEGADGGYSFGVRGLSAEALFWAWIAMSVCGWVMFFLSLHRHRSSGAGRGGSWKPKKAPSASAPPSKDEGGQSSGEASQRPAALSMVNPFTQEKYHVDPSVRDLSQTKARLEMAETKRDNTTTTTAADNNDDDNNDEEGGGDVGKTGAATEIGSAHILGDGSSDEAKGGETKDDATDDAAGGAAGEAAADLQPGQEDIFHGVILDYDLIEGVKVPRRFAVSEPTPAKCLLRWKATLQWRKDNEVDGILTRPHKNFHLIKKHYPHNFHGKDKLGRVIYIDQPGRVKPKKMREDGIFVPDLLQHYIYVTEFMWSRLNQYDEKALTTTILDLEGVGMRDLAGETLEFVKKAIKVSGNHYPERSAKVFIVNAPWYFAGIWRLVSPFVPEATRKKTGVYRRNYLGELLKVIDKDVLPPCYGGTGKNPGEADEELALVANVNKYTNG